VRSRKKKILCCCVHVWKLFLFFSIYLETAEEYCALCPYMCVFVNTPLIPWGSGVCQCRQEWGCKWRQSLGDGNTGDESWSARCTALFFSLKSLKQTYYSPFSKCNSLSSLAWFCQQRLLVDCAPFSTTFLEPKDWL
jgi:hypothetical protein